MEVTRNHILGLPIDNDSDIGICRRKAVALATQIGFDKVKTGEIAILISELGACLVFPNYYLISVLSCRIDIRTYLYHRYEVFFQAFPFLFPYSRLYLHPAFQGQAPRA